MTRSPSFAIYKVLRALCILHGLEVQCVHRNTLLAWSSKGVRWDDIDLLRLRLKDRGFLSDSCFHDLCHNVGFLPPLL